MKFKTLFTLVSYYLQVSIAGSKFYKDQSKMTKSVSSFDEKTITPSQSSVLFDKLKPFLFYTISIKISTSSGTGESKTMQFKTLSAGKSALVGRYSLTGLQISELRHIKHYLLIRKHYLYIYYVSLIALGVLGF